MRTLALIGAGNMGGAILRGALSSGFIAADHVVVFDKNRSHMEELASEYKALTFTSSDAEAAEAANVILLAVKPYSMQETIDSISPYLAGKAVISIAAGWTVEQLENALEGTGATCLRVMPNTPAMVGEGMTAICEANTLTADDLAFAKGLFESIGRIAVVPERLFDGVIAVSGSSPAYVYMMIEAMGDAAVREGLPRATAYEMAAQAVLGSALMVLSSGTHPGALKDAVCSPGGTTIEAVETLEREGFRAAIMDAMRDCAEKSRLMSRK